MVQLSSNKEKLVKWLVHANTDTREDICSLLEPRKSIYTPKKYIVLDGVNPLNSLLQLFQF